MTSTADIPPFYHAMLLWFDPLFAAGGSFLATFTPEDFLRTMTPYPSYDPKFQVMFDQLAATYALLAFNSAIVLRVATDITVWKAMLSGMLLCDLLHMAATAKALGLKVFLNPAVWRWEDWVNLVILLGMALVRVSFLLGIGLPKATKVKRT